MKTLEDVIPNQDQRVQIIAHMINQAPLVKTPVGVHNQTRTMMYQHLRIPNHGKWVELLVQNGRKVHKQIIKPWSE